MKETGFRGIFDINNIKKFILMKKHFYLKKSFFLVTFCFAALNVLLASTTPRWRVAVQGSKDVDYYKSIAVIDDDTIYVVSSSSKVMKTTNGGVSWATTNLPVWSGQPRAICFPSTGVGYIAGDKTIAKTTDYGKTWTALSYIPATNITSAFATSENTCYFGGVAKVYTTTDGGLTFSTSATVGTGPSIVFATPAGTVYRAGGSGGIYRSTDGAATFSGNINNKTANINNNIPSIYFSDNNTGYAVGLQTTSLINSIIKTTDGGTTWTNYPLGTTSTVSSKGPNAVCIPGTGAGYVAGAISNAANDIFIRRTLDAGLTFSIDTIGAKQTDYYGIAVTPRGDVYVAGNGNILTRKVVEVTTQINNNDMGSVTGAGVYYAGETVVLTATPNTGYEFEKWTSNSLDISTEPAYSFTATSTLHAINAVFKVSLSTSADFQKENSIISVIGKNIQFLERTGQFEVYDTTGRLIISGKTGEGTIQINNNGIYIMKVETTQGSRLQKVIIK